MLSEELTEIADLMLDVGDRLEDEGDRVFLGSTNDADRIRELARRLEGLAARSEALSSPGGQGNGSSGAESAADRGPCPSAPQMQHSDGWRDIGTAKLDGSPALLIAKYPHGNGWSDIYHGWWDKFLDDCEGAWARWPHTFPPTHWKPATPPAESGASGTDGAELPPCQPESPASAAEAVSPWRPIETASEHDVAYKALGIALAALQHIQGMEPITQEITLPTVMAQHAVDALKEIEALGATSCPNPCGECRGVVRAGKCGVCGWEPVP